MDASPHLLSAGGAARRRSDSYHHRVVLQGQAPAVVDRRLAGVDGTAF